jgi:hypothetical protein
VRTWNLANVKNIHAFRICRPNIHTLLRHVADCKTGTSIRCFHQFPSSVLLFPMVVHRGLNRTRLLFESPSHCLYCYTEKILEKNTFPELDSNLRSPSAVGLTVFCHAYIITFLSSCRFVFFKHFANTVLLKPEQI